MNKFYYYLLAFVLLSYCSEAHKIPYFLDNEPESKFDNSAEHINCQHRYKFTDEHLQGESKINRKPYDVISYNLFMDWTNPMSKIGTKSFEDREFNGINKIKMRIDSNNVSKITIDAGKLLIDSVYLSNVKIIDKIFVIDDKAVVVLPNSFSAGEFIELSVFYRYSDSVNRGFFLYPKGKQENNSINEERLAYTMSEPEYARFWMPCNDNPYDKAFSSISVKVPFEFNVTSNGLLDSIVVYNGSKTFHWHETSPIATYLMMATASKFFTYSDWYHKVTNPKDSVEIQYYLWAGDYNEDIEKGEYNAKRAYKNTALMMKLFSENYGEYPFSKYGMVTLNPFSFGGMEHQTMTSLNRTYLKNYAENVISHELSHQWLGDLITCATWNDIWINEGGATWSEALYSGWLMQNQDAYYSYIMNQRKIYLDAVSLHKNPIYGIPTAYIFWAYQLTYHKAGQIYHMLYSMIGKEKFLAGFRELLDRNKFKSLETYQYINEFKIQFPDSPVDLDTFFNQWLYKPGHPEIKLDYIVESNDTNGFNLKVNFAQMQKKNQNMENAPIFHLPITLFLDYQSRTDTITYIITEEIEENNFTINSKPINIRFNYKDVLCSYIENLVLSVTDEKLEKSIQISPNPSSGISNLKFELSNEELIEIEIVDNLGNIRKKPYSGYIAAGAYNFKLDVSYLQQGVYYVIIKTNNFQIAEKLIILE